MSETLPMGWIKTTLSEIMSPIEQKKPNENENFVYIDIASIDRDLKIIKTPQILKGKNAPSRARKLVHPGDIIVSMTRPNLNAVAFVTDQFKGAVASTGFDVLRPIHVESKYIYYIVRSSEFINQMESLVRGALYPAVKSKDLRSFEIRLPPLSEQKRIVEKLDCLLTKVDACKERLDKVPEIIKRFRQSVIADAVSGKLTEDWRKEKAYNEIKVLEPFIHYLKGPASWKIDTLFNVCRFVGGSQPPKATFIYDKQPDTIRLIQIRDYKSDDKKVYIQKKLAKRFCSKTDVMIGRYGPPIFQILRGLKGAYNVALMKAVPEPDKLDNEFLYYYLQNPNLFRYVEAGSDRTAGQSGINKKLLDKYPIFVPPMDEQKEIVFRVEFLL